MSLEKTLVILKPSTVQRGLIGEITARFERKGLRLAGMKMMQLTDELLNEHYAHLADKPFFSRVKNSMMASPVIACCDVIASAKAKMGTVIIDDRPSNSPSPAMDAILARLVVLELFSTGMPLSSGK